MHISACLCNPPRPTRPLTSVPGGGYGPSDGPVSSPPRRSVGTGAPSGHLRPDLWSTAMPLPDPGPGPAGDPFDRTPLVLALLDQVPEFRSTYRTLVAAH